MPSRSMRRPRRRALTTARRVHNLTAGGPSVTSNPALAVRSVAAALALVFTAVSGAHGAELPPTFHLHFLGDGSPSAINETGLVVGARLAGSTYAPLVSENGGAWKPLPFPPGSTNAFPTDVNEAGVVIGVAFDASFVGTAVRWMRSGTDWTVEVLPRLAGDFSSYASAINDRGEIVGARGTLGYVPALRPGWLYSDASGLVDLAAAHGWSVAPVDINNAGVLIGGVERLDLATGRLETVPPGPANYQAVAPAAINDAGMMAGTAPLRSTSLNIVSVFLLDDPTTWTFLAGSSRYTLFSSLNGRGDVGYGEQGAGLYLHGLGTYALSSLLGAEDRAAGWILTGSGAKINDQRTIATLGRNTQSSQSGGVLLVPDVACGDSAVAGGEQCDDGNVATADGCSPTCRIEECSDGIENDGDGLADFPHDPGCRDASSASESPACQDGIDNDGQTGIDFDGGASVNGGVPLAEPDPNCGGLAHHRTERPSCGLGTELALGLPLLAAWRRRRGSERRR